METLLGLALGISIILLAGFTQGLTSFGFALISVPLLSVILPISEVVPIVVLLSLGTNLIIITGSYKNIEFRKIGILVAASLLAVPLGTLALVYIAPKLIKLCVGALILIVAGLMLLGRSFPVKSERLAFIPIGLLSGFLNGSISMSGPPVALFMSNQNTKKATFRANLTIYAIIVEWLYSGHLLDERPSHRSRRYGFPLACSQHDSRSRPRKLGRLKSEPATL